MAVTESTVPLDRLSKRVASILSFATPTVVWGASRPTGPSYSVSVREIAAQTGWSESNVKVRAFRARARLKEILNRKHEH